MVADFLEFKSSVVGVLTPQTIRANENASKLLTLIGLSEGMAGDAAFARQCRRKYVC